MTSQDELLACHAIRSLKARYCVLFDNRRLDEWALLFTDDATIDMRDDIPEGGFLEGGGQYFRERIPELLGAARTVHQVHEPVISFVDPDHADVIWPMQDIVVWPHGAGGPMEGNRLDGYGWYYETYRREHGVWRIARLKLVRQQLDFRPIEESAAASA